MPPWLIKVAAPLLLVPVFMAGPLFAVMFLTWRRSRVRAQRKSPIGHDMLTPPGHRLRQQMDEVSSRNGDNLMLLMVIPSVFSAAFMVFVLIDGQERAMQTIWLFVAVIVGSIVVITWRLWQASEALDKLRAGYDAELAVGQELDQLMCLGARVFHDLPGEQFNIDHVVIAPQGVFAVETKGYTKRTGDNGKIGKANATVVFDGGTLTFPTWTTQEPLQQAERQAQWLSRWMRSATGDEHSVLPIVALPGWYVDRQGRGSVRVYSGRELSGLLQARGAKPLTADQLSRAVHQVDQRCRTVAPSFNGKNNPK